MDGWNTIVSFWVPAYFQGFVSRYVTVDDIFSQVLGFMSIYLRCVGKLHLGSKLLSLKNGGFRYLI